MGGGGVLAVHIVPKVGRGSEGPRHPVPVVGNPNPASRAMGPDGSETTPPLPVLPAEAPPEEVLNGTALHPAVTAVIPRPKANGSPTLRTPHHLMTSPPLKRPALEPPRATPASASTAP